MTPRYLAVPKHGSVVAGRLGPPTQVHLDAASHDTLHDSFPTQHLETNDEIAAVAFAPHFPSDSLEIPEQSPEGVPYSANGMDLIVDPAHARSITWLSAPSPHVGSVAPALAGKDHSKAMVPRSVLCDADANRSGALIVLFGGASVVECASSSNVAGGASTTCSNPIDSSVCPIPPT